MKTKEDLIKKTEKDIQKIVDSQVPEKEIVSQIALFEKGIPFLNLLKL